MHEEWTYECKDGISPLMWKKEREKKKQMTSLTGCVWLCVKMQAFEGPVRPAVFVCMTLFLFLSTWVAMAARIHTLSLGCMNPLQRLISQGATPTNTSSPLHSRKRELFELSYFFPLVKRTSHHLSYSCDPVNYDCLCECVYMCVCVKIRGPNLLQLLCALRDTRTQQITLKSRYVDSLTLDQSCYLQSIKLLKNMKHSSDEWFGSNDLFCFNGKESTKWNSRTFLGAPIKPDSKTNSVQS